MKEMFKSRLFRRLFYTYIVVIFTYVNENATAFITGTKSLDNFDSYIEGLDALKLQEVLTVKQNQYSRYYEALTK